MPPEQSLRQGNLSQALAELQAQVRKDPANSKHRIFLFQLLCVLGDWDRAMTQLNVAGEMDASTLAMVQTYREALRCEVLRRQVFAGQRSPMLFGQPDQWVAELIEALRLDAEQRQTQAQQLRERAFEAAPTTSGSIVAGAPVDEEVRSDGGVGQQSTGSSSPQQPAEPQPFEWIADADTRLGPVLEAVINGKYYWIPFQRLTAVQLEPPTDLRDVVWMPAHLTLSNGGQLVSLLPTRYPGSEVNDNDHIRLARRTEWQDVAGTFCGLGQRLLATDAGEFGLMDVRAIHLNQASEAGTQADG
jgi:type VI secretion system protein ImpE